MTTPRVSSAGARVTLRVDARGSVREWSEEAEALLGYPASEVLGRPVTDLLTPVGAGAGSAEAEWSAAVLRHQSGLPVEVEILIRPEADLNGGVAWSILLATADRPDVRTVDRAVLRALLTESPVGLHILDTDLRLVRFNSASQGMRGVQPDEVVGRRLREVAPGVVTDAIEQTLRHVLDTGEPVVDFVQPGYPPSDPAHHRVFSMSAFQLKDESSRVLGVAGVVTDATERYRARARLDLLNDAGSRIGTTLDVTRTAQELAEVAVPQVADAVEVDVLDSVFQGDAPGPGPVADSVTLRHTAFRSTHGTAPAHAVGERSSFSFPTPFTQCLADLRPRLVPHLDEGSEWLVHDPPRAERVHTEKLHSLMVVPLSARGVVLGVAAFYRSKTAGPFEEDDLTVATELAARAALCIDNARRYTRERNLALTLQRSLLPQDLPAQTAVESAYAHIPADADGNWYDVIPLPGARVALVVGDVQGHGIQAVVTMGRLRAAVHSLAGLDLAPDELLAHLDDLMVGLAAERRQLTRSDPLTTEAASATSATCIYAVYDPVSRHCVLARAGHPAPVIAFPDGTVEVADIPDGPPLGMGGLPFETAELTIPEGSLLALYTEGLVRSGPDGPENGLRRLERLLAHPRASAQDACDAVVYGQPIEREDDGVVLLLARTRTLGADLVASWTLPSDPAVVSTARRLVDRQLATWGLQDLVFTTELLVSELVTNAIRYATGPIILRLVRDRTLICEVSDGSSTAPRVRHPRTTDEGGRGLLLVAQLTRRWGTRYTAGGKIVWTEQALPTADPF
ncbi:SpoIIE family protein phosphatase [Kitasatospora sp. NBC_00085]|uniref:SpoIIE family protein phosphatase n=1 Tax=unclassified Kitasatospora TaxID=2633591 RepID=UPI0032517C83